LEPHFFRKEYADLKRISALYDKKIRKTYPVSTDTVVRGIIPQACRFLKIKHCLHSSYEKTIIERTIQSIKDRTENFDDYFPCTKVNANCNILEIGLTTADS
jgi:hypothetical protein